MSLCLGSPVCECPCLVCIHFMSWLASVSGLYSWWVPFTGLHSFHVLTCLCVWLLQDVSAPHSFAFILCLDFSLCLCSLGCECPLLAWVLSISWLVFVSGLFRMCVPLTSLHSFCVLTCLYVWALQSVSAPCWFAFVLWPDLSLCLGSPVGECPSLAHINSLFWLVFVSALSRMWVPLAGLHSFYVLTCLCFLALQDVSAPCLLTFSLCPNLSICLSFLGCECQLVCIFSTFLLVFPSVLSSW